MKLRNTIQPQLPHLVKNYLDGDIALAPFFSQSPSLSGLLEKANTRKFSAENRKVLIEVLTEQANSSKYAGEVTRSQIDKLKKPTTFTVVTGHQVCLFGGPMFFPYKILSAIKLARSLEASGLEVVPVYWMASEDHDLEEVDHFFVGDKKYQWKTSQSGAVGPMVLEGIDQVHDALMADYKNDPLMLESLKKLKQIYASDRTLAEATRDMVYWLFGEYGIVVIDAAHTRLKALFAQVIFSELTTQFSYEQIMEDTAKLESLGFSGQITPREVNLFWMDKGLRERILKTENGFSLADGSRHWTKEALLGLAQDSPEMFSPNVALRPIYQETILPNLSYIGGPGELSYWFQLKGAFQKAEVPFPVLVLRDMALLLPEKIQKRIAAIGLKDDEFYADPEVIFREKVREKGTHEHLVALRSAQIEDILNSIESDLTSLDEGLGKSSAAERTRILRRLNALEKKVFKADKRRNDVLENRVVEVFQITKPNGIPQERHYNLLEFCNLQDPTMFFDDLLTEFNPLKAGLKVFDI